MSAISGGPLLASLPLMDKRLDRQSLRVGVLILAVAILNAIDLLYTVFADRIGMLNEMNPITSAFLQAGFLPGLVGFKIIMVGGGLGILWKLRHNRLAIPGCWILLSAYVWLGFVWIEWVRTVSDIFEIRLTSALP